MAAAAAAAAAFSTNAASAQEPPIFGFDVDKAKIITALLDPRYPELSFVAIYGSCKGAVGKTTLAREIYASAEVQEEFDVHIWLFSSRDAYKEMRMQIKVADSHPQSSINGAGEHTESEIADKANEVREYLNGRKFCLVIDNCEVNYSNLSEIYHWDEISKALPDNKNGSRVLWVCQTAIDTRKALMAHPVHPRSKEESLEILKGAANLDLPRQKMKQFLDLARRSFVPLCHGLPWPLYFMGVLLSTLPPDLPSWTHFLHTIKRKYPSSRGGFVGLAMKFRNLKSHSERAAFLSFLTFSHETDALIAKHALFAMWIAERIANDEEDAHWIMQNLVRWSIVEVNERLINGRLVEVCRMVDPLVRALAIQEAKLRRFVRVCSNNEGVIYKDLFSPHIKIGKVQVKKGDTFNAEKIDVMRLADATCSIFNFSKNLGLKANNVLAWYRELEIHSNQSKRDVERLLMEMASPRYLALRNSPLLPEISNMAGLLDHLEMLVVEDTPLEILPLASLLHENMPLKHLILTNTKLCEVPSSVQNLKLLQTLNVSGAPIKTLPEFIGNLTNLKTLNVSGASIETLPEFIENLTCLHTLNVSRTPIKALPKSIEKLRYLHTLDISDTFLDIIPEFIKILGGLSTLNISGLRIKTLPDFIGNLTFLHTLNVSRAPIKTLPKSIGKLEYLQNLDISDTSLNVFPEFILKDLKDLRTLDISGTSIDTISDFNWSNLQYLRTLNANGAPIKTFPDSFVWMNYIQTLDIRDTFIRSIPGHVWWNPILRSVLASDRFEYLDGPPPIRWDPRDEDSNLETITIVNVSKTWKKNAVPKLPNLRKLGLSNFINNKHGSIRKLKSHWLPAFHLLRTLENLLSLMLQGSHIPAEIICVGKCPSYSETLMELWVGGSQSLFSLTGIEMPPRLTKLTLENLEFEEDPMPILGKLQDLQILHLRCLLLDLAKNMSCSSDSFPCLERLDLYHLTGLKEWSLEEGAMPKLIHVLISNCKALEDLPNALLQRVPPQQELHLHSMPSAFTSRFSHYTFVHIINNPNLS